MVRFPETPGFDVATEDKVTFMMNYIVGSWTVVTKFGGKIEGIAHQKGPFLFKETPKQFSNWKAPYKPPAPAMGEWELKKLQDDID